MSESQSNPSPTEQASAPNMSSSSASVAVETRALRGRNDIGWNHVTEVEKGKYKCLYCGRVFSGGGIHRMKKHLAKVKGDVSVCKEVPYHIQQQIKMDLDGITSQKPHKQSFSATEESSFVSLHATDEEVEEVRELNQNPTKKLKRISKFFPVQAKGGVQPSIKCAMAGKDAIDRAHASIGRWFFHSCIPFNAMNSPYFQEMVDNIITISRGFRVPTYHDMRGFILKKNYQEIQQVVNSYKEKWKEYGCTIMADGWTDQKKRTLINFLVYCSKGTIFLKSVDASTEIKTANMLCDLFKKVIEEVGSEHVVQLVTDNASNYKLAGEMLKYTYPHIVWTPCAAHCLDLMLEDIAKIDVVSTAIDDARSISTFIYNDSFALALMRKYTDGKELIRPAMTRFATHFLAIQSLLTCKDKLRAMVVSKEWDDRKWRRNQKVKTITDLILCSAFWERCEIIVSAFEPLVRVLRLVDSDERPSMGYIFESMRRAKKAIEKTFKKINMDCSQVLKIINTRWENQLRHPLHLAGFYFNPMFFYHADRETKFHTWSGVLEVIERLNRDDMEAQVSISEDAKLYRDAVGDFGRPSAIAARYTLDPALWWESYGCGAPKLQVVAIKVLSQTCSSSGCERNWSVFERIHTKKRNRLEHGRLNDLVYVQYNLRLLERKKKRKVGFDPISLDNIDILEDWTVESEDSEDLFTEEDVETWMQMDQPQAAIATIGIEDFGSMLIQEDQEQNREG